VTALVHGLARLSAALGIRPDERRRVALLAIFLAAAVGGVMTIGYQGVAMALFVGRLPTSAMPLTLIPSSHWASLIC
jgi:hypothetical protein